MTPVRRGPARLLAEALLVLLVAALLWWGYGGRWVHVESPSMGTAAPVGSLLWVSPADRGDLVAGDLVTFHAPRPGRPVYTHRVVDVGADGSLRTAGDLSGADPWTVARADVVGEVRAVWPGLGWLVVAAPLLVPGLLVTVGIVAMMGRRRRAPTALLLSAVLVALVLAIYRPLLGAERLAASRGADGVTTSYVGTGLLPVRISALRSDGTVGSSVVLRTGEQGTVTVGFSDAAAWQPATGPGTTGEGAGVTQAQVPVRLEAALPRGWWLLLAAPCLVPGLVAAARRGRRPHRRPSAHRALIAAR